jgi:hypothetical protein
VQIFSLISWAGAPAVGFLTFYKVFTFTTAPALDTVIVAAVLHFVLMLISGHKVKLPARA